MYTINIPILHNVRIVDISKKSTSLPSKLLAISINPLEGKIIEISSNNRYYVNSGRYAIVYTINEELKTVNVLSVPLRALLYKVLRNKVKPDILTDLIIE